MTLDELVNTEWNNNVAVGEDIYFVHFTVGDNLCNLIFTNDKTKKQKYIIVEMPDAKNYKLHKPEDINFLEQLTIKPKKEPSMTNQDKKDLMALSIKIFSERSQVDQLHEEIGELMAKLNQYRRGRVSINDVVEEIVDVKQCLDTIIYMFDIDPEEYNKIEDQQWNKMKNQIEERLT